MSEKGEGYRNGFVTLLGLNGKLVTCYRDYGKPSQSSIEVKGFLETKKGTAFWFADRFEIYEGDIVRQQGTADLWKVVDMENHLVDDTYHYFEVKIEKA